VTETGDHFVRKLLELCPEAQAAWDEHTQWWGNDERGHYNDLAVIARHLVKQVEAGNTTNFEAVFTFIEKTLCHGSPKDKELATVGLLEDIQTIGSNVLRDPEVFTRWLGPVSTAAWEELHRIWEGKESLMDVVRAERQSRDDAT